MHAYFKSFKTFETLEKSTPQSWEIPIFTSTNEDGNLTIPLINRKNYAGDWVYIAGHFFLIDESNPNDGFVELKLQDPANIFSRKLIFPNNPESTYGAFIANRITSEFINCSDSNYRITYLTVTNEDSTPFETPNLEDDKLYSLLDIINAAREKGVILDFNIPSGTTNVLNIHIYTNPGYVHNVYFTDGHAEINNETYSRTKVAKITILKATEEEGVYTSSTWYLSEEGNVSTSIPAHRAEGDWEYIKIGKDDDAETEAKKKFKENIDSHKIEFYTDRSYNLWDTVRFQLDDQIMETKIVSIILSSDTDRTLYKCGDLATTLTDKVKKK